MFLSFAFVFTKFSNWISNRSQGTHLILLNFIRLGPEICPEWYNLLFQCPDFLFKVHIEQNKHTLLSYVKLYWYGLLYFYLTCPTKFTDIVIIKFIIVIPKADVFFVIKLNTGVKILTFLPSRDDISLAFCSLNNWKFLFCWLVTEACSALRRL